MNNLSIPTGCDHFSPATGPMLPDMWVRPDAGQKPIYAKMSLAWGYAGHCCPTPEVRKKIARSVATYDGEDGLSRRDWPKRERLFTNKSTILDSNAEPEWCGTALRTVHFANGFSAADSILGNLSVGHIKHVSFISFHSEPRRDAVGSTR